MSLIKNLIDQILFESEKKRDSDFYIDRHLNKKIRRYDRLDKSGVNAKRRLKRYYKMVSNIGKEVKN